MKGKCQPELRSIDPRTGGKRGNTPNNADLSFESAKQIPLRSNAEGIFVKNALTEYQRGGYAALIVCVPGTWYEVHECQPATSNTTWACATAKIMETDPISVNRKTRTHLRYTA